jgi:hypothetical protein
VVSAACSESTSSDAAAQEQWRENIVRNPTPESGCFEATYPSTTWARTQCGPAPTGIYGPRGGAGPETVGASADYAAQSSGTISQTVGSFPKATGTAGESGPGGANVYSIQLNSNFMAGSKACNGAAGCKSWQQFVYSSKEQLLFIQSWLIPLAKCPAGWMAYSGNCYTNSGTVSVSQITSDQLGTIKMSATATAGGNDAVVFSGGTVAKQTSAKDTTAYLSAGWTASEFNVFGDGSPSPAANFKPGASVAVNVAITGGTPSCQMNAGTTAETNNLVLGSCTASGGSIQFTEVCATCAKKKDGGKSGSGGAMAPAGEGGTDDADTDDMDGGMSCNDDDAGDASDGDDGGDASDGGDGGDAAQEAGDDGGEAGNADGGGGGEGGTTCDNSSSAAPPP